jgi:hypothetical protein
MAKLNVSGPSIPLSLVLLIDQINLTVIYLTQNWNGGDELNRSLCEYSLEISLYTA